MSAALPAPGPSPIGGDAWRLRPAGCVLPYRVPSGCLLSTSVARPSALVLSVDGD